MGILEESSTEQSAMEIQEQESEEKLNKEKLAESEHNKRTQPLSGFCSDQPVHRN